MCLLLSKGSAAMNNGIMLCFSAARTLTHAEPLQVACCGAVLCRVLVNAHLNGVLPLCSQDADAC